LSEESDSGASVFSGGGVIFGVALGIESFVDFHIIFSLTLWKKKILLFYYLMRGDKRGNKQNEYGYGYVKRRSRPLSSYPSQCQHGYFSSFRRLFAHTIYNSGISSCRTSANLQTERQEEKFESLYDMSIEESTV
jgi:hypothetical protein